LRTLLLSLALITGIAQADTTDNLVNQNGELDHQTTYYGPSVEETYTIPQDAIWRNPSSIDWSVDVRSYDNAIGCYSNCVDDRALIYFEFYDVNNNYLTSDGPGWITLDHDTGGWSAWVNYSGSYTDETYLSEINSIRWILDGRDRGYWAGNYGPQFRNASLTFEYDPVEEELIIQVEEDVLALIELIESGEEDIDILDEYFEELEEELDEEFEEIIEIVEDDLEEDLDETDEEVDSETEDVSEEMESEEDTSEESGEESSEEGTEENEEEVDVNDESTFEDNISTTETGGLSDTLSGGEEVLNLLDMVQTTSTGLSNNVVLGDVVDISSYTSISLSESVELEDNEDWYQNESFYEDSGTIPDSGILNSYKYNKIVEIKFYD